MIVRLRVCLVAILALAAWFGGAAIAHADVCASHTNAEGTLGTVCVTSITPEGGTAVTPQPGVPVTVIGNTQITATVTYSPTAPAPAEQRGCYGQRKVPSGCLSWLFQNSYTLTQLFDTSGQQGNRTYTWTWATSQYPNTKSGSQTLSAQIQMDGVAVSANVPVVVSNAVPGSFPSPIANNGLLPIFSKTAYPFTVAAFGDGPAGSNQTKYVANLVHSWNPDMLMYLGDVYQRGMPDEFMNFYNPIYGADAYRTITTIGNHEYKQLTNGQGYFWYWNFPNGSPTQPAGGANGGGTGGGSWYSLNVGGPSENAWHIISLNSNVPMSLNPVSPQGTWLQQDLAADVAARPKAGHPCTLAFWHAPRFSDISLRLPSTSALWNQLYPYGDDIIVNAHSHVYERWQPLNNSGVVTTQSQGITQFVVGTGGNVLAQVWNTNDSRSAIRQNTTWGALKLMLYADHADYQYWETDNLNASKATLFDSGTITCR